MSYSVKYEKTDTNNELPLNLEIVKQYLNVSIYNTTDDYLLTELILMASEYAEWYIEKSLTQSTWKLVCDGKIPKRINLSFGPVKRIESIILTQDNIPETLNENKYIFDSDLWFVSFKESLGDGKIVVNYSAGYTQDTIPYPIRCGLLQNVYYLYINNEKMIDIKSSINNFYNPFKIGIKL